MAINIRCRANGPLVIEGEVEIFDSAGNKVATNPDKPFVALCRCGLSANKPLCDGNHNRQGWKENPESGA